MTSGDEPMRALGLTAVLVTIIGLSAVGSGCGAKAVEPRPTTPRPVAKPLRPLTGAEMQKMVSGAARLNRACLEKDAPTGVYVIRLLIESNGRVSSATPRSADRRARDPSTYTGVPRYIDSGPTPDNAVTRCYARALSRLRFRRFGGPTVGFDFPVVVEKLPPSEDRSTSRDCQADGDCTFRPRAPCACPRCGTVWRRAISLAALRKGAKRRLRQRKRCKRHKRHKRNCKPCDKGLSSRGTRALCIRGQCSVR